MKPLLFRSALLVLGLANSVPLLVLGMAFPSPADAAEALFSAHAASVAVAQAQTYPVGASVEVLRQGTWIPATIKSLQGPGQWLVGYAAALGLADELVGVNRLRRRAAPGASAAAAKPKPQSTPAPTGAIDLQLKWWLGGLTQQPARAPQSVQAKPTHSTVQKPQLAPPSTPQRSASELPPAAAPSRAVPSPSVSPAPIQVSAPITQVSPPPKAIPAPVAAPISPEPPASDQPRQPQAGFATGRVTMADGSALRGDIQDVTVTITGISEAGVNVTYVPVIKPDGTYRQRLVPGAYSFCCSTVTVVTQGHTFKLPLEPVGALSSKRRDAAEGLVQDFVWKVTGPTPYGQSQGLQPENHTHWYGTSIGIRASAWRDDLGKAPPQVPAGTRLLLTLQPLSRSIDGQELAVITLERPLATSDFSLTLNDLVPANYALSGIALLPDGTRRPVLFSVRTPEGYRYRPEATFELQLDSMLQRPFLHRTDFVLD